MEYKDNVSLIFNPIILWLMLWGGDLLPCGRHSLWALPKESKEDSVPLLLLLERWTADERLGQIIITLLCRLHILPEVDSLSVSLHVEPDPPPHSHCLKKKKKIFFLFYSPWFIRKKYIFVFVCMYICMHMFVCTVCICINTVIIKCINMI